MNTGRKLISCSDIIITQRSKLVNGLFTRIAGLMIGVHLEATKRDIQKMQERESNKCIFMHHLFGTKMVRMVLQCPKASEIRKKVVQMRCRQKR